MGTTSTTVTANWTVYRDAADYPTVVSGDDVTVYVNNSTSFFTGEAWSDVDTMDPIPAGATITNVTFDLGVQTTGPREFSGVPMGPDLTFIDKAQYLTHAWSSDYGTFGRGGPGDIPNDNDPHDIAYDNSVYPGQSGGAGIVDMDAFAAALSEASTPVILMARGPNGGATGTGVTYSAPLTITFYYDDVLELPCDTTVDLGLATAKFTGLDVGGPFGQYGDSVIYTANSPGFPDFYIGGLDVDSTSRYHVTMSYASGSAHDAGGRGFSITGVIPGHEDDPNTVGGFPIGDLYDGSGNTADSVTVTIGPGINGWDDPTYGVAAGYTRLWFETDRDGALSAISIRKVCNPDLDPVPPTVQGNPGAGSAPRPDAGPPEAPVAPGAARADGFLSTGARRGAPTGLEVVVAGQWLSLRGLWGDLTYSTIWPGGSANASWTASRMPRALTRRDLPVQIMYAGEPLWSGVLDLPQGDGQMNAVGLFALGQRFTALDGDGLATTVPDDAIDAAISRGLRWKRRVSFSADPQDIDTSSGPVTLGALLDACATDARSRWAVDPYGYVFMAADPTTPAAQVLELDGPLSPADDDVATALIGRYKTSSGYATTPPVVGASESWLGYSEDTVDLTGRGVLTEVKAVDKLQALLDLGRALPAWADPIQLGYGDLFTAGQVPVEPSTVAAGLVVRVQNQLDDTRSLGGSPWADVLVGQTEWSEGSVTLTPIGAPVFGLYDAITQLQNRRSA